MLVVKDIVKTTDFWLFTVGLEKSAPVEYDISRTIGRIPTKFGGDAMTEALYVHANFQADRRIFG